DMITLNLHLLLHLYECAKDFGPLYAFWCFLFERMNGVLKVACLNLFKILRLVSSKFYYRFIIVLAEFQQFRHL
ncbi:hypothetical protein GLOIN_2v1451707, partial [Rhizophagus irregularis DAOM 181602=DAOM 197198]